MERSTKVNMNKKTYKPRLNKCPFEERFGYCLIQGCPAKHNPKSQLEDILKKANN